MDLRVAQAGERRMGQTGQVWLGTQVQGQVTLRVGAWEMCFLHQGLYFWGSLYVPMSEKCSPAYGGNRCICARDGSRPRVVLRKRLLTEKEAGMKGPKGQG